VSDVLHELPDGQSTAAAYGALADCYGEAGEFGEAEVFYRRALVVDPAAVGLHVRLARTLLGLNRPDEAEGHLRRALTLEQGSSVAACAYAELCLAQGRLADAARILRGAFEAGPTPETHAAYAELAWSIGALADAERHYGEALRDPEARPEVRASLGLVLISRRRTADAEPHLRAAADALGCAASLTNHANALAELGRADEAMSRYRAALAADDECAEAQWGIAQLTGDDEARARALAGRQPVEPRPPR